MLEDFRISPSGWSDDESSSDNSFLPQSVAEAFIRKLELLATLTEPAPPWFRFAVL